MMMTTMKNMSIRIWSKEKLFEIIFAIFLAPFIIIPLIGFIIGVMTSNNDSDPRWWGELRPVDNFVTLSLLRWVKNAPKMSDPYDRFVLWNKVIITNYLQALNSWGLGLSCVGVMQHNLIKIKRLTQEKLSTRNTKIVRPLCYDEIIPTKEMRCYVYT